MKLQTLVDIPPSKRKIGVGDTILTIGSCFSDEIGAKMQEYLLDAVSNPFGTLYNPLSIAQAINYPIPETDGQIPLVEYDGLWHSMAHHGAFSRRTREEAEEAVRASVETMQRAIEKASVIIITFGTAWVYEGIGDKLKVIGEKIVGNCHKMPGEWFSRRRLTVEEIVTAWGPILDRYPDKHWIFTVSPIRHAKDGFHENQLSKATLLMAIEQLCTEYRIQSTDRISYFPSYEIQLDELRDYRFYADDLVHPSSLAVEYIWERFVDTFFTPQDKNELIKRHKEWKFSQHKPHYV